MPKKQYPEEYKEIIKDLDEIKVLLTERDSLLKSVNKNRRKLRTKLTELSFISDLIVCIHDRELEIAVKNFLKALGYTNVHHVAKSGEEDIQWFVDNKLILIEITGCPGCQPPEEKIFQVLRRVPLRQSQHQDKSVHGVFIVSHDNKNAYMKRCSNPFNKKKESEAKASKITLMTVTDLLDAFIDIKTGKVKPEALVDQICTPGIFKENWALHKLETATSNV